MGSIITVHKDTSFMSSETHPIPSNTCYFTLNRKCQTSKKKSLGFTLEHCEYLMDCCETKQKSNHHSQWDYLGIMRVHERCHGSNSIDIFWNHLID